MNAIETIEDLMQILNENPEWLEVMHTRLLTRELLELPEKLTQFTSCGCLLFGQAPRPVPT